MVDALAPHRAPALADDLRIGRVRAEGQQRRAPLQILIQQAATHVVGVVGVAVVGRAERDDRLERGRIEGGDLERVEAAPGDAHHADRAAAPALRRDPGDDLERVVQLLLGVLVEQHAVGVARAAQIDPHGGIAGLREITVDRLVARAHEVALAIRDVLENRRYGLEFGARGQPDPRRDPAAVGHGDPDVLDLDDVGDVDCCHLRVQCPAAPRYTRRAAAAKAGDYSSRRPGTSSAGLFTSAGGLARRARPHHQSVLSNSKRKAAPSDTTRPADGRGKCAVHTSVSVSP